MKNSHAFDRIATRRLNFLELLARRLGKKAQV